MHQPLHILRGLMALSILIFHYEKWTNDFWNAKSLFGVLGVYGVSIFFVLSGMVLTLSSKKKLDEIENQPKVYWKTFFKRRFWRIFPLLWLATFATLVLDEFAWSGLDIFLNYTGLFGFLKPSGDIATGAWSIGCELVYYALFPLFFLLFKRFRENESIYIVVVPILLGLLYAFKMLQTDIAIKAQWANYVQPANHLFFFVSGMYIAFFSEEDTGRIRGLLVLSALILWALFFACYVKIETPSDLITGAGRVFLSFLSIVLCWICFDLEDSTFTKLQKFSKRRVPSFLLKIGLWLGHISYSLYLLHPLVYRVVRAFFEKIIGAQATWEIALCSLPIVLVLSHLVYFYIEKRFVRFGKML